MAKFGIAALAAGILVTSAASAQTTATAPSAAVPAPSAGVVVAKPKTAERCFRLPLSDVAFGTENATNAARAKLDEYAQVEQKKRKWPQAPLTKSKEMVSCEVYLNLGPVGTEYRCLVTATFCQK